MILVVLFLVHNTFAQNIPVRYQIPVNSDLLKIAHIKGNSGLIEFNSGVNIDPLKVFDNHKSAFALNSEDDMVLLRSENDKLGYTHYRYQQYYKGTPVEGTQYIVHAYGGRAKTANGKIVTNLNIVSSPNVSADKAVSLALNYVNAEKYMWEDEGAEKMLKRIRKDSSATYFPKAELLVMDKDYSFKPENYRYVYKVEIMAQKPLVRKFVYVDALTGKIYHTVNMIQNTDVEGLAETKYNQAQIIITDSFASSLYRLRETTRGGGVETYNMLNGTEYGNAVDFTDDDNYWDVTANQADAATNAHWSAEMTYDYYFIVHGRLSYDNNDSPLLSFVHYDQGYANAFWNGEYMTYGDGDGSNYSALTSIDVCGHEITHAVTEYSANLIYQDESGAMNESFSDIFGTCIEFFADTVNPDWYIGEDFDIGGNGFRNMSDPSANGDPDTYLGTGWDYDPNGIDNGGVHTNNGVGNFWFYLLCDGGAGTNDNGAIFSVAGIGIDKAAQIAFRTLTVYLTPSSEYYDFRTASIQAAEDLYGPCSTEMIEVSKAWYAVGVGYPIENNDLWMKEIRSPVTACGLGNEVVSVVIVYNGCDITLNPGDTIFPGYSLNGGTSVYDTLVLTDTLHFGDSLLYTFFTLADASVVGTQTLHAWVNYPPDIANYNDEITDYTFEHILQQNIDVGVVTITAPLPGCELGMELVEVEVQFFGCDSLPANEVIPVAYKLNNSTVVWDTIVTDSVIYSYETIKHVFSTPADLSVSGTTYTLDSWTAYLPDSLTSNDLEAGFTIKNPIILREDTITFEATNNSLGYMIIETSEQSNAIRSTLADNTGLFGLLMTGGSDPTAYMDLLSEIDSTQLWTQLWPFIAKVNFCVDVTNLNDLYLNFDLKQTFSSIYESYMGEPMPTASSLRILVNDVQLGDIYNPVTENADPYLTYSIHLDSLAGTTFQLSFQSMCFIGQGSTYGAMFGPDNIYLDNIFLSEFPDTSNQGYRINEIANSAIELYPNPNSGVFFLDFSAFSNEKIQIVIHDLQGRKIMSANHDYIQSKNNLLEIDISDKNKGIYICKITAGSDVHVKKIILE